MTLAINKPTNGQLVDLEALYRDRRDGLVRFATGLGTDSHAAEDVVHNAFEHVMRHPDAAVKSSGTFVTSTVRYKALEELQRRSREIPTGERIERDPGSGGATSSADGPCMGDPAVADHVHAALVQLPEREQFAVRLHCLEGLPVSVIARQTDVSERTVSDQISRGLRRLGQIRNTERGSGPTPGGAARQRRNAPTIDDLVAVLARKAPGQRIGIGGAECLLRDAFGSCSQARAVEARDIHNGPLPADAPRLVTTASQYRIRRDDAAKAVAELVADQPAITVAQVAFRLGLPERAARRHLVDLRGRSRTAGLNATVHSVAKSNRGDIPTVAAKGTPSLRTPAEGADNARTLADAGVTQAVAEAWLTRADDTVTALFVHADESTSTHPAAFRSMPGAQREITGHLVGQGYRPDGPWTAEGDTETWRRFTLASNEGAR